MKRLFWFTLMLAVLLSLSFTSLLAAQEEMPLTERGSYHVGVRPLSFVDEVRDGREIEVWLWYPAVVPEAQQEKVAQAEQRHVPTRDLAPDMSGAPYPLVLYSYWYQGFGGELNTILEPLVSRGFVVAYLDHPDSTSAFTYIDRPLDVLFAIDQLAALNDETGGDLAGLMNTDQIGVMGSDDGADAALMVSGARVDPQAASQYTGWWGMEGLHYWYPDWEWTAMAAYHDQLVPPLAGDPLWPAMTDPRIRAVVAYAPSESVDLMGERGLAEATVPALVIGGTKGIYDWYAAAYNNLGSAERYLLTLIGVDHELPYPPEPIVQQVVTAFFGYHLQGKTEYAEYLTEDYIKGFDNVVWGIDETAVIDPRYFPEMTFPFTESGTIGVGDTVAGEIPERGVRMGYHLTLDADTTLNLYANAKHLFDPVLYVCDPQGEVLFWNDELTYEDDEASIWSAGLEGLALPAGSYTLIVSGFGHRTGLYELVVESAE